MSWISDNMYFSNSRIPLWVEYFGKHITFNYDELIDAYYNIIQDSRFSPSVFNECSNFTFNNNFYHSLMSDNINHNIHFLNFLYNNKIFPIHNIVNYDDKTFFQCYKGIFHKLLFILVNYHSSIVWFQRLFRFKFHKHKFSSSLFTISSSPPCQLEFNIFPSFQGGSDYINAYYAFQLEIID